MGNSGDTILPFHTCKRNMANDFQCLLLQLNIEHKERIMVHIQVVQKQTLFWSSTKYPYGGYCSSDTEYN